MLTKTERFRARTPALVSIVVLLNSLFLSAQQDSTGRLEGAVRLADTGTLVHNATVVIPELSVTAETDRDGRYSFEGVPVGRWEVVAMISSLSSEMLLVEISPGQTSQVDLTVKIGAIKQELTVTAKGLSETAFQSIQSVRSLDNIDLADRMATSIGEVLQNEVGVAKRSFGPGSSRPVIRGFDNDRVLIMQNGIRVGSLGSQSGDHGEPLDVSNMERIEIVRGPATLLYGSNAVGGVVNTISHHHDLHTQAHEGLRGRILSGIGSNDEYLGGSFNADYGTGNFLFWVGGGGQRSDDYETADGPVENSKSRIANASGGFGWYGDKAFSALEYSFNDGRYGIPFANVFHGHEEEHDEEEVVGRATNRDARVPWGGSFQEEEHDEEEEDVDAIDIYMRRHNIRFSGGVRSLDSGIEGFHLGLNYTKYRHQELEILDGGSETEVGTTFDNQQFIYRGTFHQARRGPLSGSFGFWGMERKYDVEGEEALSPPVDQRAFALFALEEVSFERIRLQFGARVEHTSYKPQGPQFRGHGHEEGEEEEEEEEEAVELPDREFTGFSGGAGARVPLWENGAFVANFTTSYRAAALEELYNFGPHVGNLAFEIGNPNLMRERSNARDLALRHQSDRISTDLSFFYYRISDFVFLAPTGEIEDGLVEAEYLQGDSRFVGTEFKLDFELHPKVWFNLGLGSVNARLTDSDQPLPRIPPLRGSVGLDFRTGGFRFKPSLILADRQDDVFEPETPTGGYAVVDLLASYTLPRQHFVHHFSFNVFNLADRVYRNHLSFIKDFAPEIGRGVRFSYTVSFF